MELVFLSLVLLQPELVVHAPEYMTVEYLKRRVVRAKLQRGDKVRLRPAARCSCVSIHC
jgi:hypothetical protein